MFPEESTGPPGAYQIIGGHRLEQTQFCDFGLGYGFGHERTPNLGHDCGFGQACPPNSRKSPAGVTAIN